MTSQVMPEVDHLVPESQMTGAGTSRVTMARQMIAPVHIALCPDPRRGLICSSPALACGAVRRAEGWLSPSRWMGICLSQWGSPEPIQMERPMTPARSRVCHKRLISLAG